MSLLLDAFRTITRRFPEAAHLLSVRARLLAGKAVDLSSINAKYHDKITRALINYFEGSGVAAPRNQFKQAMIQAFSDAFDAGWIDGGGELPIDDDAMAWVEERLNQEAGYIDGVFAEAKELRKDEEFDYFNWITQKADGYTASIPSVFNAAKLLANDRQMLTWHLGNAEKHCRDCLKLNGQRHRASWYISRNYIPRKPGASMECQGYNCDCKMTNDKNEEVTI